MAVEMFMKIEGIPGESQDKFFRDSIVVQAWNWGASNPVPVTPRGAGATKPVIQNLTFIKSVDKTTPTLYLNMLQGKYLKTCILSCRKAGAKDKFFEITMSDCLLNSALNDCKAGEENITETIGIQFSRINIEYTGTDASGKKFSVKSGWDIVKNMTA
jgi:type VI secretion system secreted protein Hcp